MKRKGDETQRATRWRRPAVMLPLTAVAVGIVVGYLTYRAAASLPGIQMPDQGNHHLRAEGEPRESFTYNSDPPTSGPHLPYIAPWGVHTRPLPRELQVHNLEDGGVLVQYSCDCPELVTQLRAIVERHDKFVILAPYPTMKSRIALTAWTRLDAFDQFDEKRVVRFIDAYRGLDHHK